MKNYKIKIHIGYVLKSADVRTQASGMYSENSSHTYPCTSEHTRAHSSTPAHIRIHIPAHFLNLINHIKLYINRPNTKMADRRKKEKRRNKSPLKHFSGLKRNSNFKCWRETD